MPLALKLGLGISGRGGGKFSPASFQNLAAWYDASDPSSITQVANRVSQWRDKSGSGCHLEQPTGAAQPLLGTYKSKPSIYFETDDVLNLAGNSVIDGSDGCTIAMVCARSARSNSMNALFIGLNANTALFSFRYSSTNNDVMRTNARMVNADSLLTVTGTKSPALGDATYSIATVQRNGSSVIYQQGGNPASDSPMSNNMFTNGGAPGFSIGATWHTSTQGDFFTGHFMEVAIYRRVLSAPEMNTLTSYLQNKWATV